MIFLVFKCLYNRLRGSFYILTLVNIGLGGFFFIWEWVNKKKKKEKVRKREILRN